MPLRRLWPRDQGHPEGRRGVSWGPPPPLFIEHRIRLEPDGGVTAFSGKVDFGQGIRTAFGQIVAEELDLPLERVRVVLGDTAAVPWDFGTFGSMSIKTEGATLRRAAAGARAALAARAAGRLGVDAASLEGRDGAFRTRDGRTVRYAELAGDGPLTGEVAKDIPLKPRSAY
ncbi:MAG: isoquinoline 1-oxidoreductase, partial [Chloroflexi bacterium]|nr:isoquinoline 1-oxidoreductase [Chloroflexota bacterium]